MSSSSSLSWLCLALHLLLLTTDAERVQADFRHISYDDLNEKRVFQQNGVTTYSQLLFDVARQQVVVGARDNLYRLTLNTLTPVEHAPWPAKPEKVNACQNKGQTPEDCHNYVKVLLSNGKSLFTCGTNAFSPQCSWREIENITKVTSSISGLAMCPYSPHANSTAILARGQSAALFTGTPTDFSGMDTAIYRNFAPPSLRTSQYDSKWLNDPQFVGSFETEDYVYFLFRESAVEYINCGKRIYSRIGRVCKYDPGSPMHMKNTWTTFSKARLNCSLPGEFPFYYDEIQGAAYQPEEGIVYATFTTPSNAIAGSAICAFNMSQIHAAFDGPYKHQANSGAAWERKSVTQNQQKCGPSSNGPASGTSGNTRTRSANDNILLFDNQLYQLMDGAVQSHTTKPLYTATLERFTHLAVDVTPTKAHPRTAVLYVSTTEGLVKKISVLPGSMEACIIEVWGPLPSAPMTLQFLKETKSLYVGMESALLRIPTVQCHRHRDSQSCLNAQEPYCGWDEHLLKCTAAPSQTSNGYLATHWRQDATKCPILDHPVQGGWSAWSAWHECKQFDSAHYRYADDSLDSCQCQTRECNNPLPQNGGHGCSGIKVRVSNCTVHGGWTAWSAWSACSQTCGLAIKSRRRTCTNPAPQHGGRICLGPEQEDSFCIELPPCPTPVKSSPVSAEVTSIVPRPKATWSPWGPWNQCSKMCGGGYKIRKRTCEGASRHDAGECSGCNYQVEDCNNQPCQETKKFYNSPWTKSANLSNGGHTERRYRFVCRAQTDDPSSVRVITKEEERHCRSDGSCGKRSSVESSMENSWSEYSSWSACSHSCGGGKQFRVAKCDSASCEGSSYTETRACNTKPCPVEKMLILPGSSDQQEEDEGQWSCWTDWTACSVSCGFGTRSRTRECLGPGSCSGPAVVWDSCEMPSCEYLRGWDSWTPWSRCDSQNLQHRKRKCLTEPSNVDCVGANQQSRRCWNDFLDNDINALPSRIELANISMGAMFASCLASFLAGLALTAMFCFYYTRRQKPRIPSSPHYISRQNPYVTVPLKEVNTKRQPSFSGSINGTLRSNKNNSIMNGLGSPKLYPKALVEYESATLKRNSREAQIRAEFDQEKYY